MHIFIIFLVIALAVTALDLRLKTVKYSVESEKVNGSARIALITDLHSCVYGRDQENLINAITESAPDLILIGGDFFSDEPPGDGSLELLDYISKNFPCYYVTGNHEYRCGKALELCGLMTDRGVTVLRDECAVFKKDGVTLNICGLDDPSSGKSISSQLDKLRGEYDSRHFTVLLTHRPEYVDDYLGFDCDLILAGHAHGGQVRLPGIINGLYAPNQGWFPKYAGGLYKFNGSEMIVSRGLGKTLPKVPRVFNRPELVIINIS